MKTEEWLAALEARVSAIETRLDDLIFELAASTWTEADTAEATEWHDAMLAETLHTGKEARP